jgi:dihydrofolate reductase
MLAIVCTDSQGGISKNEFIPWYLQEDLKFYKAITQNRINWVSRNTWESLPFRVTNDPRRAYKLLTTQGSFLKLDKGILNWPTYTFSNLSATIDKLNNQHILVGGHQAYLKFIPKCDVVIETTLMDRDFNCDCSLKDLWPTYKDKFTQFNLRQFVHSKYGRIDCNLIVKDSFRNSLELPKIAKECLDAWEFILSKS